MMKRLMTTIGVVAALSSMSVPIQAAPNDGVKVGVLTCSVEGGTGFVFGSSRDMRCVFDQTGGGGNERYIGYIDKFGLDIGYTGDAVIAWTVFAPTEKIGRGALSGNYVGVAADASIGVGGGGKLLVGGSDRTISLQPLSAQAQTGLNAALAVASVTLKRA